jgi:hypothetical protein
MGTRKREKADGKSRTLTDRIAKAAGAEAVRGGGVDTFARLGDIKGESTDRVHKDAVIFRGDRYDRA